MKKMKFLPILVFLLLAPVFTASPAGKKNNQHPVKSGVTVNFAERMLQGYDMRVWLSNQMTMGLQAWDAGSGAEIPRRPHYGLEYPTGSGIEHLYGAGPCLGGIINGVPRVDEGYNGWDARKEFLPEYSHLAREHFWRTRVHQDTLAYDSIGYSGYYYLKGIAVDKRGVDNDADSFINEDDLDGVDNDGDWNPLTDDVGSDGLPDSLEVSCSGKPYDPQFNPDPAEDNYDPSSRDSCHGNFPFKNDKDIYTEKNGIPDHGEPHVDEDYGAVSDNDLYCSATDTFRTPVIAGHVPMGIKVIQKSYAWHQGWAGILPFDYYFINTGNKTIEKVYVGFMADMDVGPVNIPTYPHNNYACYNESFRTAYIHNPIDRGSTPLGVTILKAPFSGDSMIWQWYDFTTRPGPGTNDSDLYSWMSGAANPAQLIAPCQPTTDVSDTRFFFSFGPIDTLRPRDTVKLSIALVAGVSLESMFASAQRAIDLYNIISGFPGDDEVSPELPGSFQLSQNYPNPFNPETHFSVKISKASVVDVSVYDILGRKIATLVNGPQQPGVYDAAWDGKDGFGINVTTGVYFVRMKAEDFSAVRKILLVK